MSLKIIPFNNLFKYVYEPSFQNKKDKGKPGRKQRHGVRVISHSPLLRED